MVSRFRHNEVRDAPLGTSWCLVGGREQGRARLDIPVSKKQSPKAGSGVQSQLQ